jgi:opacity protein-like surface antigen
MKTLLLFLMGAGIAGAAGPFSVGIRGGIPLTDFFNNIDNGNFVLQSANNRYIVGPTAELRLPFGFGIEVDALYRRLNYNASLNLVDVFTNNRTTGNAWEFPLLAKYRFATPIVKPYVDAGIAFDTLSGVNQTIVTTVFPNRQTTSTTSSPAELSNSTTTGFVIGLGAEVKAIFVRISPEIRYTHWGSPHFKVPNGSTLSNQSQAEFLVGFTF